MSDTSTPTGTPTSTSTGLRPALTAASAGSHFHFLNHLATIKSDRHRTASGMNAVEFTAPRGFGPPLHLHREEDEIMYVVSGEIRLRIDGDDQVATDGAVVSLPAGVPHTFQVVSERATFLTVAGGRRHEPSFDEFVAAMGRRTPSPDQPAPTDIDPGHVAEIAGTHGIEIIGPPPAALD
jgi:quercetin dioxygenase-like cupin family protein